MKSYFSTVLGITLLNLSLTGDRYLLLIDRSCIRKITFNCDVVQVGKSVTERKIY